MSDSTITARLLSAEQAAQVLGCGRSHIFGLLKSGDLRSIKVGRLRRIPVDEVDAYVSRLVNDQASA